MFPVPSHRRTSANAAQRLAALMLLACLVVVRGNSAKAESGNPFDPRDAWLTLTGDDQIVLAGQRVEVQSESAAAPPQLDASFRAERESPPDLLQFQEQPDTSRYVGIAQWSVMVAVAFGAAWMALKRLNRNWIGQTAPARRLELLETLSLGPRGAVALIRCDGTRALVGCDAHGIKTISFFPPSFADDMAQAAAAPQQVVFDEGHERDVTPWTGPTADSGESAPLDTGWGGTEHYPHQAVQPQGGRGS